MVRTLMFLLSMAQVQSLARELRSHKTHSATKKKKKIEEEKKSLNFVILRSPFVSRRWHVSLEQIGGISFQDVF